MDQLAREDIAAAAAVHHELGRDYDGAVAEGLIERIGAEIDKRVDARLGGQPADRPATRSTGSQLSPAARTSWATIVLGLGSMSVGALVSTAVLNASQTDTANGAVSNSVGSAQVIVVAIIWIIIGIVNVAYARRH